MKDNILLKRLEKWIGNGNTESEVAAKLGYKTSYTVSQWLKRKSIPKWQRENVKAIIRGDK